MKTKRETENTEYAGMVRRMVRAHGRRVANGDEADLAELVQLRTVLEAAIAEAVVGQRRQLGSSWATIARGLGSTRQAAQQRYGGHVCTATVECENMPCPLDAVTDIATRR